MYNLIFSSNHFNDIHEWEIKNQSIISHNLIQTIYKLNKEFSVSLESNKIKFKFYSMNDFENFFSKKFKNGNNSTFNSRKFFIFLVFQ